MAITRGSQIDALLDAQRICRIEAFKLKALALHPDDEIGQHATRLDYTSDILGRAAFALASQGDPDEVLL